MSGRVSCFGAATLLGANERANQFSLGNVSLINGKALFFLNISVKRRARAAPLLDARSQV